MEITIITPPKSQDRISEDLRSLTELICNVHNIVSLEGLGGTYGYGVDFENDIFMMHPFCFCESPSCNWCEEEYPNFLHKKSNFKVHWYKWIGRSNEVYNENKVEWSSIFKECLSSISQ